MLLQFTFGQLFESGQDRPENARQAAYMTRLGGRFIRRRGIHVTDGDVVELGGLKLQSGATLHTPRLAYQTHRRLNTAADNAVGLVFEVDARVFSQTI